MKEAHTAIYYITGGNESVLRNSPLIAAYRKKGYEVLIMDDDIDDFVIQAVSSYQDVPLKAINKSGAMEDLESEEDKAKAEARKGAAEKIKKALGDKVKDVVVSSRLEESPAAVIVDENDPSAQMQKILKQMGSADVPELKPILEINPDSALIDRIDKSDDEAFISSLSLVLLDQALLQEGIMPQDANEFARNLVALLS